MGYVVNCFLAWLPRKIASLPFDFLGWFVVPFMWRYRAVPYLQVPHCFSPWLSIEDWTGGWREHPPYQNCIPWNLMDDYDGFWGFWRYHAMRNASAGLKTWRWFTYNFDNSPIRYETNHRGPDDKPLPCEHWYIAYRNKPMRGTYWYKAWQNNRRCYKRLQYFRSGWYYEFKIGWRISPQDAWISPIKKQSSFRWKWGTTTTLSLRYGRIYGT